MVDVRVRELDPMLLNGDYEQDRDLRRRIHHWLGDIWREKDDRLAAALGGYESPAALT
jgi:hypothetical protein